jgi:hypothetical protein
MDDFLIVQLGTVIIIIHYYYFLSSAKMSINMEDLKKVNVDTLTAKEK